jgi:hypothetical protein
MTTVHGMAALVTLPQRRAQGRTWFICLIQTQTAQLFPSILFLVLPQHSDSPVSECECNQRGEQFCWFVAADLSLSVSWRCDAHALLCGCLRVTLSFWMAGSSNRKRNRSGTGPFL